MERKLPTYIIEGTEFIVDVDKGELREADKPANTISFFDMLDTGSRYAFQYDKASKNMPALFKPITQDIVAINLPQMVELDPAGMATKYGIPVTELKGKKDFDIIVDQRLLNERKNGILPLIKIAGHEFVVDLRLSELRPLNDFSTRIDLNKLDVSRDGEKFLCFYHVPSKQVMDIPTTITELPKDVVMLEIPNELILDPVAVARRSGLSDEALLKRFPLQSKLEAKVVPLSETGLPSLIRKNKAKLSRQKNKGQSARRKKGKKP